jgi:hypothetical protein
MYFNIDEKFHSNKVSSQALQLRQKNNKKRGNNSNQRVTKKITTVIN